MFLLESVHHDHDKTFKAPLNNKSRIENDLVAQLQCLFLYIKK